MQPVGVENTRRSIDDAQNTPRHCFVALYFDGPYPFMVHPNIMGVSE
jgi:hypothetical protein